MKYKRGSHVIFNINYHIVITTKYRKPYLYKVDTDFIKRMFQITATKHSSNIINMG